MNESVRAIGEIGFGIVFSIGAIFNLTYTLRNGEEFFGSFADNAWLKPSRNFVRRIVIPRAVVFTIALVAFQVAVATLIFMRGDRARAGLLFGALFGLMGALVSSPGGAIANLALAGLMTVLALAP
jgi:hypothetical protein